MTDRETEKSLRWQFCAVTASGLLAARCYGGLCSSTGTALLSWMPTVWIQSELENKSGLAEKRERERENLILTDVDKDKTLCASLTGRDNIPKLEKVWGQTDRDTCVVKLQRQALEGLGRTCLTGTTGLQTLGVLWLEERPCWCWGGRTARIWQPVIAGGVQTLWFRWTIGPMSTVSILWPSKS